MEKLKIVLPDIKTVSQGDIDISELKAYGNVITYEITESEELSERLRGADIILCNKSLMNAETLKYADNLKYIGVTATGYNNIDLEYTNSRGIVVSNAPDYSTDSVAQHTFALILNHYNRVAEYNTFVNQEGWMNSDTFSPFIYTMQELRDKTIGIIGFGNIGVKVAKIARAFDMNVIVYSRDREKTLRKAAEALGESDVLQGRIEITDIEKLVALSDIVTIHCPLNKQSEKLINETLLSKFKTNAILINTARGPIVDESALYDALENGVIAGAAIDVLETEPMKADCILMKAKNIVITPHVAWAPYETRKRLFDIVVDNLKAFLNGQPKNVVGQ